MQQNATLFDITLEKYTCPLELQIEMHFRVALLRSGCLTIASECVLFCKKEEPRKIFMYSHDMGQISKTTPQSRCVSYAVIMMRFLQ